MSACPRPAAKKRTSLEVAEGPKPDLNILLIHFMLPLWPVLEVF
jgi:hypothetical protein